MALAGASLLDREGQTELFSTPPPKDPPQNQQSFFDRLTSTIKHQGFVLRFDAYRSIASETAVQTNDRTPPDGAD